jgi:tetrahedral aminopeptidase
MDSESLAFLHELLKTPSPSGFEQKIQKVVKNRMEQFADHLEIDLHGNLIVGINTSAKRRVMLAGHCDQIGFMVKSIDAQGFIYVAPVGGIDKGTLAGSRVNIQGKKGVIPGIFGRKPIHHQSHDERERGNVAFDKVWIDIGAKNQKEALNLIEIGAPVVYEPSINMLGKDFICAPGLDDKVGLFIAMEALRLVSKKKLNVALFAVSTVQEEVGLRGAKTAAYSVDPEVGIAIDVTFASDNPGKDGAHAAEVKLGGGPCIYTGPNVNPTVESHLKEIAKKSKIKVQSIPSSTLLGNDANAIQVSKRGVATASLGVPNRYMHTPTEVCSLKDLENSAKLLAQFIQSITQKHDFRP